MLAFITGGIYTLAVLAVGMLIGWSMSKGVDDEVLDEIRRTPNGKVDSGSLKPYTPEELANQTDPAVKKMASIFEGFRRDN